MSNGGSTGLGGNYQRRVGQAAAVLQLIESGAQPDCGSAPLEVLSQGSTASHGLPSGYAVPAATSPPARASVKFALAQLGKPYLWGGNGPSPFACSGLTQQAWTRFGVHIGRVVSQQMLDGPPTVLSRLVPGDLVMIPGSIGTMPRPGHVGMNIGYGLVVNAPGTGDVVRVVALRSFVRDGLAGLRHVA